MKINSPLSCIFTFLILDMPYCINQSFVVTSTEVLNNENKPYLLTGRKYYRPNFYLQGHLYSSNMLSRPNFYLEGH